MDKHELSIKIEQLSKLVRKGDYATAARVADQLEWKKMKQWSVMSNAIDAYIAIGKYDKARNVCIHAYNRNLGGRRLLATLTEMYIKLKDYDEAADVYREFVDMAPRDSARYTLQYKLRKAQGAPVGELIDILEEYKENELDEVYAYELASLYSEAGLADRCVKECDDMVLWFSEGVYVEKALRLKKMYAPLTPSQEERLARLERISSLGLDYDSIATEEVKEEAAEEEYTETEETTVKAIVEPELDEAPEKIELVLDDEDWDNSEEEKEDTSLKRSNILSIIPAGFKNKVKSVIAKELVPMEEPVGKNISDNSTALEEIIRPEATEEKVTYEEEAYREDSHKADSYKEEHKPVLTEYTSAYEDEEQDPLENTTTWVPVVPENEAADEHGEEEVFNAVTQEPEVQAAEETEQVQLEAVQNKQTEPETDVDDIKIEIKDYSVYDTRNLQQELKASLEEIMEAYQNREEKEAMLDENTITEYSAEQLENEPTKEIIINKHQWRKSSRNRVQTENSEAATVILDVEAIKAGINKQEAVQEPVDDQIEGQMDIMQWLSELEEEEKACNQVTEQVTEVVDNQITVDVTEEVAVTLEVTEDAGMEEPREIVTEPEIVEAETEPVEPEPVQAELEESEVVPEVVEEAEIEFEEIPEVEDFNGEVYEEPEAVVTEAEPEEVQEATGFAKAADEDDFPDLDEAISAGIEKIIDDTMNEAIAEHNIYDDIANYVLQPEERKFLGKYLYMSGMESHLSDFIGEKRLLKSDGTSSSGNAAVMGNKSTDKTAFAVNLVKAIHAFDDEREQTIARTTAENLNAKGIGTVKRKLLGGTLIIENAGKLIRERITDLVGFMSSETEGTLIIIADEEFGINKIFMENPDFAAMFTGRFLLKQYTVNELVGIAKDYAAENGWKIEDKALLKLYLILSRLHNDDQGNIVLEVKDIMDTAAANAGRHIGNRLFKKVRQTLTLKEADFEDVDEYDDEE